MSAGRQGAAGPKPPVVRARELHRDYPGPGGVVRAVRGVSLDVEAGAFVALLGPSGSGKSTLLHLLGAVDTPTSGTVEIGGRAVHALGERERARLRLLEVGLVFQRFHLLPMLSARENVELPMAEAGTGRRERRRRADELLRRVGLGARLDHRPPQLSGGERQRVAIARALANSPRLLLADEPTGELDRATSRGIVELFAELNAGGATILVATHDDDVASAAGGRHRLLDGSLRT